MVVATSISARSASTSPDDDDDARSTVANEEAATSVTPIAAAFDATASHEAIDDRSSTPSHAAAAINDDMRLAREIRIIDRLTSVYGFPHRLALDAMEECGHLVACDVDDVNDDDECVVACYNWILDSHIDDVGVVDSGGPVVPRTDCPHVSKRVRLRIVEMGMDGTMEATAILGANDEGEEHGGSTTIVPSFAGEEGFAMHRSGTTGGDRTNLMNVECQYHRYADRRRRVRRRMRRTPSEGSPGGRTPLPAVGRLKSDFDDDGFEDAHLDINTFGVNGGGDEDYDDDDVRARHAQPRCCAVGMNWLCLECGAMMCSRYANGHARAHYEMTKEDEEEEGEAGGGGEVGSTDTMVDGVGHCIAVCLADLSVWCYRCNAYLRHPTLDVVTKYLEGLKFGDIDARIVMTNVDCDERIVIGKDFTFSRSPLSTSSS